MILIQEELDCKKVGVKKTKKTYSGNMRPASMRMYLS